MLELITDSHIAMGGTMDPWPPEIQNMIVWAFVAITTAYLVKRIAVACKGGLVRKDRTLRESWAKFVANGYRPDEVLEPKIEPRTIRFDLKLVLKETNPKRSLIIPTNPKQMRPVEGK